MAAGWWQRSVSILNNLLKIFSSQPAPQNEQNIQIGYIQKYKRPSHSWKVYIKTSSRKGHKSFALSRFAIWKISFAHRVWLLARWQSLFVPILALGFFSYCCFTHDSSKLEVYYRGLQKLLQVIWRTHERDYVGSMHETIKCYLFTEPKNTTSSTKT